MIFYGTELASANRIIRRIVMGNAVIIAILVLTIGLAVYSTIQRIRYGSSCCGERDPAEKKIKVADTNINNYPYTYTLQVDGMHCANCARRVENALNRLEGRWAVADVGKKEVLLRSKREETENEIGSAVDSAGYTMLSFRKH
jgi:copper chaperone CopZ